jgi:hypothetical protein
MENLHNFKGIWRVCGRNSEHKRIPEKNEDHDGTDAPNPSMGDNKTRHSTSISTHTNTGPIVADATHTNQANRLDISPLATGKNGLLSLSIPSS